MLGPLDSHIESCCLKPEHWIKGPNNKDIIMALYTKAYSSGVYINAEATTRLATFIVNLLIAKKACKIPTITNDDFITHKAKYGVISGSNDVDQDEDLDFPIDAPIDNAIMLAESKVVSLQI